jgi:hypothetical protein
VLSKDRRTLQRMVACPPRLMDTDPTPSGWQSYHGTPAVFHCGFRGIPNQYDSAEDPLDHTFRDSGGIYHAGAEAFFTSRVHDINTAVEAVVGWTPVHIGRSKCGWQCSERETEASRRRSTSPSTAMT